MRARAFSREAQPYIRVASLRKFRRRVRAIPQENKLTEREFVVSLAIAYLMRAIPSFNKSTADGGADGDGEAETAPEGLGANQKRPELKKRSSVAHINIPVNPSGGLAPAAAPGTSTESSDNLFLGYGKRGIDSHHRLRACALTHTLFVSIRRRDSLFGALVGRCLPAI